MPKSRTGPPHDHTRDPRSAAERFSRREDSHRAARLSNHGVDDGSLAHRAVLRDRLAYSSSTKIRRIEVVHGWVYFAYVLTAFNLAIKVRWPIGKTIGVLLSGHHSADGHHRRALPDQGRQGALRAVKGSSVTLASRSTPT